MLPSVPVFFNTNLCTTHTLALPLRARIVHNIFLIQTAVLFCVYVLVCFQFNFVFHRLLPSGANATQLPGLYKSRVRVVS